MASSKVDLSEIRSFALGDPYDGEGFIGALRDLCDTVCNKHFRSRVGDDELYDVAICKVTQLLCHGAVDFRYPPSKCFSFLYTTVRNVIGNWIKAREKEVAVTEVFSRGLSIRGEDVALARVGVGRASRDIVHRLDELKVSREGYGGFVWRASLYRAMFEE